MTENSIPADLIVSWAQTGARMVPVNEWTMPIRGSKQVSFTGLGDTIRGTIFSREDVFAWTYSRKYYIKFTFREIFPPAKITCYTVGEAA